MKIAVIDTGLDGALSGIARSFLPKLLKALNEKGDEIHLIPEGEEISGGIEDAGVVRHTNLWSADDSAEKNARGLADWLNKLDPDVYLIWASARLGWLVLPLLNPRIATVAVGHADAEIFYAPARHYRPFLTRVVGATAESSVGFVINCVIDKERVEWISYEEQETTENLQKTIETYRACFEKAIEDAQKTPRQAPADFPPLKTGRGERPSWFAKLRAKLTR